MILWYNILVENNITEFIEEDGEATENKNDKEPELKAKPKKDSKPAAKRTKSAG